jgi:hypothetical protein
VPKARRQIWNDDSGAEAPFPLTEKLFVAASFRPSSAHPRHLSLAHEPTGLQTLAVSLRLFLETIMNGLWGAGLLTAAVLLFSGAYIAYRQPNAGAWIENEAITTTIAVAITAGLGLATASLLAYSADVWAILSELEAPDYILIAMSAVFVIYAVWRIATPDLSGLEPPEMPDADILPFDDGRPSSPAGKSTAPRSSGMKRAA